MAKYSWEVVYQCQDKKDSTKSYIRTEYYLSDNFDDVYTEAKKHIFKGDKLIAIVERNAILCDLQEKKKRSKLH